jgi:plasmid stability protein
MGDVLIRKLDEVTQQKLRQLAAMHSRSLSEEMAVALRNHVRQAKAEKKQTKVHLAERIHKRFKKLGGLTLPDDLRMRNSQRELPDFSGPEYDRP